MADPTPCPICSLPGGFHDTEDPWSDAGHRAHQVPRRLVRPSNNEIRRVARTGRRAADVLAGRL
jgi:hypothetical protein